MFVTLNMQEKIPTKMIRTLKLSWTHEILIVGFNFGVHCKLEPNVRHNLENNWHPF